MDDHNLLMPANGTLERVLLEAMMKNEKGVTFFDLDGTGIAEANIDQIANNLRNGMFIAENDGELRADA